MTDSDLPTRLRNHVYDRLPDRKDGPLPNGAWRMMLDAANEIEYQRGRALICIVALGCITALALLRLAQGIFL